MTLPRLLIIGHGRHGKDTVCEILRDRYGFRFQSSSEFCARKFIYDELKTKYGYANYDECYRDRHNHRSEWYGMIHAYCEHDHARLGRDIFSENDIYCGLRNRAEFHAMRNTGVFDYCVWVDRSDHAPPEPRDSMNLEIWMADHVIDNNSTLEVLNRSVGNLADYLLYQKR
jgi:hypothetical protein